MRHHGDAQKHGVKSNAPLTEMNDHTYSRAGPKSRDEAAQHVDGLWTTCV
jgi:hypothetical protein